MSRRTVNERNPLGRRWWNGQGLKESLGLPSSARSPKWLTGEAALQAGNSESIIRKHYLDLKTPAEAEQFFGIFPTLAPVALSATIAPVETLPLPIAA